MHHFIHARILTSALLVATLFSGCKSPSEQPGDEHGHDEHEHVGERSGVVHDDKETVPDADHHLHDASEASSSDRTGSSLSWAPVSLSWEAVERAEIAVGPVTRRAIASGSAFPAEVEFAPTSTAHVGPLVPGRLTRVKVTLGERVKKGQLLGTVASSDVSAARARLDQAKARLTAAESALARQQQLASEGIGAQRSVVEAESNVAELRAEVEGLRQQLSVFGSGSSGELTLTAPIDGVVVALHATLGEMATPETPTFIVTDPTKVWVRGAVPELDVARVTAGARVVVRLAALPDLAMQGTVSYLAPALDPATRSLPVKVAIEHPDPRLVSGLFGTIELDSEVTERPLVVPSDAVASAQGLSVVFVPTAERGKDREARFEPRVVGIGRRARDLVEIQSGLDEGVGVVVSGAFVLASVLRKGEMGEGHSH